MSTLVSIPVNCTADPIGMVDGLRAIAWYLETHGGSNWRMYAPLSTFQLFFGSQAVDSYAFYYTSPNVGGDGGDGHGDIVIRKQREACAWMMLPSAMLTILIMLLLLAIVPVLLHVALFAANQLMCVVGALVAVES